MPKRYNVFVSYGQGDHEWVDALAGNLHRVGLEVFLDKWEILPGDLLPHRLQQGLEEAETVVGIVSPKSISTEVLMDTADGSHRWLVEELSAAIANNVAGRQRFIPVVIGGNTPPPFVLSRIHVDFRNPEFYQQRFADLTRAIRGEPLGQRPQRGGQLVIPAAPYPDVEPGSGPVSGLTGNLGDLLQPRLILSYRSRAVDPHVVLFLQESFGHIVEQDYPTLFECREFREARGSPSKYPADIDRIHVEVHVGVDIADIEFPYNYYRYWIDHIEREPVIILHVRPARNGAPEFRMLCFHDWLLGRASLPTYAIWRFSPNLPLSEFSMVDPPGDMFHEKVKGEIDRVSSVVGSPWRTLKDYRSFPVDEPTLLEFMEFAPFLEVPAEVLSRLRSGRESFPRILRRILGANDFFGDPDVDRWLSSLRAKQAAEPQLGFERQQFGIFRTMLETDGLYVKLPRFTGREVGCWRIFTTMYPESLKSFANIIQHSADGKDVAFASAMLPVLALSKDPRVEANAKQALLEAPARVQDFASYDVRRELLRAPAEAGVDGKWLDQACHLITTEGSTGLERNWLSRYGWTMDVVEANIERKLGTPTIRDANLKKFYQDMGEVVSAKKGR